MDFLLEAGSRGPLVHILSFLDLRTISLLGSVSRSFQSAFFVAIRRPEAGFSGFEISDILNLRHGASESVFLHIVDSPRLDWNVRVRQGFRNVDPLSYCCLKGFLSAVRKIVRLGKAVLASKHLNISCNVGNLEIVKILVEEGGLPANIKENYPLFCACSENHIEIVKYFLSIEDVRTTGIEKWESLVSHVARHGTIELLRLILGTFEVRNLGFSSLVFACERGMVEMVREILMYRNGAAIDPQEDESFALKQAAQLGHVDCVVELLKDGRSDVYSGENFALRLAAKQGHVGVMNALLKGGEHFMEIEEGGEEGGGLSMRRGCSPANPRLPADPEKQPLYAAIRAKALDSVRVLLEHPEIQSPLYWDDQSFLEAAADSGSVEMVELMLQHLKCLAPERIKMCEALAAAIWETPDEGQVVDDFSMKVARILMAEAARLDTGALADTEEADSGAAGTQHADD